MMKLLPDSAEAGEAAKGLNGTYGSATGRSPRTGCVYREGVLAGDEGCTGSVIVGLITPCGTEVDDGGGDAKLLRNPFWYIVSLAPGEA